MKKISLKLVGLDGNAFSLMAAFSKQAKKEGWNKKEIREVLNESQKGNYDHLVSTLAKYCKNPF
jgi:hypothetical protein